MAGAAMLKRLSALLLFNLGPLSIILFFVIFFIFCDGFSLFSANEFAVTRANEFANTSKIH
jgi:hypothetical protein